MIIKRFQIKRLLKKILVIVAACVVIYIIINILNHFMPATNKEKLTDEQERKMEYNTPAYGNLEISEQKVTKFSELIDNYFNYCNKKEYEKAYNLIDYETKQKFFPTIEEFKVDIDQKFDKLKLYEYKNIVNYDNYYAYRFIVYNDVMTYGSNGDNERKEYILIIKDYGNELKLNTNSYIKTEKVNYSTNVNNINVQILEKEIFYEYTNLKIKITNSTEDLFVLKNSGVKYYIKSGSSTINHGPKNVSLNEIFKYVQPNSEKEVDFRFDKSFAASYDDYLFYIEEAYLVGMEHNYKILTNQLQTSEIDSMYKIKFDIQIGL